MKKILLVVAAVSAVIPFMASSQLLASSKLTVREDRAYWQERQYHHHCRIEEVWRRGQPFWMTVCGWDNGDYPSY